MIHYYAYICKGDDPIPFYDRTFGAEYAADRWIEADPEHRFVMVGMVAFDSYY